MFRPHKKNSWLASPPAHKESPAQDFFYFLFKKNPTFIDQGALIYVWCLSECPRVYSTVAHKCNTQNSIPLHKTQFHYTKQNSRYTKRNSATQNKIPLHETKFHYTKQNSRYTKLNSTTQNSIPLHKTQFLLLRH